MPNTYIRKTNRASWSEDDLQKAVKAVSMKKMSLRQASRQFNIPSTTLRNRIKNQNYIKKQLGPSSQLGFEAEKKLVGIVKQLQTLGFEPTRKDVRVIAYKLAESLGIQNTFNKANNIAGKVWLASFLRRNPELSVKTTESTSKDESQELNHPEETQYSEILSNVLLDNNLIDKSEKIWNSDENDTQLDNHPAEGIRDEQYVECVLGEEKQ